MTHAIYLSLGSNIDGRRNLPAAVRLLARWGDLRAVSPVYETDAVGARQTASYLNAAVLLVADLEPEAARSEMIATIERSLGRRRNPDDKFAPRTIDIDISLWDDRVLEIAGKPVPDPDTLRYLHVAQPLADVAPDLRHPTDGRTLAEIAASLQSGAPGSVRRTDLVLPLTIAPHNSEVPPCRD